MKMHVGDIVEFKSGSEHSIVILIEYLPEFSKQDKENWNVFFIKDHRNYSKFTVTRDYPGNWWYYDMSSEYYTILARLK